jgi:hypothetical protein
MSAIRPSLPDTLPQRPFAADTARNAQAAFFQAALGQAHPTRATTAPTAATPVRSVPTRSPLFPDAPEPIKADRPLRPGALLDIRV